MNIRKCKAGEIEKIIDVADKSFKPDRSEGFTFKNSLPQIYDNPNWDYSENHFVAENKDNKFVSVVGNLIDEIKVKDKPFKFSRIGTVGTLPDYRGQRLMKQLMAETDKENQDKEVVFSVLCGKRNRYNNFGYERAGWTCCYTFDKDQQRYLQNFYHLSIKPFEKSELDEIYEVYKQNQKFILRSKEDFQLCLNNKNKKLYTFIADNQIVGYCSIKGFTVCEINLSQSKFVESAMACLLSSEAIEFSVNKYNDSTISVCANLLNIDQRKEFDKIAEYKTLVEEKSFKIYNLEKFIEMLFLINEKDATNCEENYNVENKIYKFKIQDKKLEILPTFDTPLRTFKTKEDFIRFVLGSKELNINSKIFPLYFDLNSVDNF